MTEQYRLDLDCLQLTEASKTALIAALKEKAPASPRTKKAWRYVFAAAAVICILVLSVSAVALSPILEGYFGDSPGYRQSSIALGEAVTKNGWTMTITDCVADKYNLLFGLELTAPEGTVLDREDGYFFEHEDCHIYLPLGGLSAYCEYLPDDDLTDSTIRFIMRCTCSPADVLPLNRWVTLTFEGLCHTDNINGENEVVLDCGESWSFTTRLSLPGDTLLISPNASVTTLGVDAVITEVEVTPIGVYVHIEGDALKGHHSWVEKNAPDGWYGCVEFQDITLHLTDGTTIPMTSGLSGSGCSGGTDTSEAGYLHLARRADNLINIETVDYITICGVDIPLQ